MSPTRTIFAVACIAVISACGTLMAPSQSGFLSSYSALSRDGDHPVSCDPPRGPIRRG